MTAEEIVECVRRMDRAAALVSRSLRTMTHRANTATACFDVDVLARNGTVAAHEARRLLRLTGQLEAEEMQAAHEARTLLRVAGHLEE